MGLPQEGALVRKGRHRALADLQRSGRRVPPTSTQAVSAHANGSRPALQRLDLPATVTEVRPHRDGFLRFTVALATAHAGLGPTCDRRVVITDRRLAPCRQARPFADIRGPGIRTPRGPARCSTPPPPGHIPDWTRGTSRARVKTTVSSLRHADYLHLSESNQ